MKIDLVVGGIYKSSHAEKYICLLDNGWPTVKYYTIGSPIIKNPGVLWFKNNYNLVKYFNCVKCGECRPKSGWVTLQDECGDYSGIYHTSIYCWSCDD